MARTFEEAIQEQANYRAANPNSKAQEYEKYVLETLTVEQFKERAGSQVFKTFFSTDTSKARFRCGNLTGPLSENVDKKLKAGIVPNIKVELRDVPALDGKKAFFGFMVVEEIIFENQVNY